VKAPPAFGGDLGLLSLFDLGQLLRLNGATGRLTIRDGERTGSLYFDGGELVNAVDDRYREGEEAALALFPWRSGSFEFHAEPLAAMRTIESTTEAVMLEAARRMDEDAAGDDAESSETRRLREHRTAMESLRDVFRRVAGEARETLPPFDPLSATAHLYELTEPEDRLLYRPGRAPCSRRRGAWARVPEASLSREEFENLCARLHEACDPVEASAADAHGRRRMTLGDGRVLAVERLDPGGGQDSLWIRPLGPVALDPATLDGDIEDLEALLARREGLLLLGAPDATTCRRLVEAVARLAIGPADTLVLVSREAETLAPHVESGVALCTTPRLLAGVIETVQPEIVALDPGVTPGDLRLEDLAAVPRVLAGVVGTLPRAMAASWCMRVRRDEPRSARAWLRAMLCGVVAARPDHEDDGVLVIGVHLPGERGGRAPGRRPARENPAASAA
jgi:hypothetical protein